MRCWRMCAWVLAGLLCAKIASAQAGVYGLFTGANLDSSGVPTTKIFGPTFGIYADFSTPVVKFGGDVRGALLTRSGVHNYYGVTGPRLEVDLPVFSLKPYAEALAGGGESISKLDPRAALHIDYELLAGVDRKFTSLLEWRVLEFSYTSNIGGGGSLQTKALSSGLVVHIP